MGWNSREIGLSLALLLLFSRRRERLHVYEPRVIVQWENDFSFWVHYSSVFFLLFCTSVTDVYLSRISSALFPCKVLVPPYFDCLLAGHLSPFNRRTVGTGPEGICLRKNWPYYYYNNIINNYSSSPNGLWVNSPWGRGPNGLLTQRPWGREE